MGKFDDQEPPPSKVVDLQARKAKQQPYPYTWVSSAELQLDSRYLVKGLIDQGSFSLIYGPSGSGKSFFTADLAQHIATGQAWRGKKVNKSLVVYVASEAGASIIKRFIAWRENKLSETTEDIPLAILTRGPSLILKQDIEKLKDQLNYLQDEAKLPLGFTVFDTLSRSMPGGDENESRDMTEAINTADYLREEFKCSSGFVHHSGKDEGKGARGHSSLFAAADLVLRVVDKTATVEKIRDGVSGTKFPFALLPVELGFDQDGEPVTTCLLSETDSEALPKRGEPSGKNQKIVLKEIRALSPSGRQSPGTSEIPKGVMLVSFEALVEKAGARFPGLEGYRLKARISEALSSLQASSHVGVYSELLWLL